jgi:aryl-alcohol dehydrogenase-like predicted oxidoreductase
MLAPMTTPSPLPSAAFGSTGRSVTRFGLGGEGVLRTHGREREAAAVIRAAIDAGVTYYDSARAYAGSEGYYGAVWRERPDARARVLITSKSASRDAAGARRDLATTLASLAVDHIDLWQLHDLRTEGDLRAITARGGALEAFLGAREEGRVRHIGVTGHHDPAILLRAVRELPVESVLLPINPMEGLLGGFLTEVVAAARERSMAVVGMKVLGQGVLLEPALGLSAAQLVRYALAQGPDTVILGCSTPAEVASNVAVAAAAAAAPMSADEQRAVCERVRPRVAELAYYRGRR